VSLASDDIHTPDAEMINQILAKHDAGYKIELPDLVVLREQTSIAVEVLPPSLSDQSTKYYSSIPPTVAGIFDSRTVPPGGTRNPLVAGNGINPVSGAHDWDGHSRRQIL